MLTLQGTYVDDYSALLPVFLYQNPEQLSGISGDMDRSVKKATKLISMHSITAKPEIKDDRELTQSERDFYSKSEFNKWVDDAYLLMGKAYFYQNEHEKASETFSYLLANFSNEPTIHETRIWLARLAIEKNRFKEAEEYIGVLEEEKELPKHLWSELKTTLAYRAILKEDYEQAIIFLKEALETIKSKYFKQRYNYILAQLYQETGQSGTASEYYQTVIKMNPPYEMTFNARINMALTYQSGASSMKDIEKQLQKMLKDDKNIDFQDQIYYAWGNLYYKAGDVDKALEYYLKSTAASKGNTSQLARTYLTVADIYYEQPQYVPAQSYYDSAVGIIDVGYPNYPVIYAKSISLTNLVAQIQTVELEDSVRKLSAMPKPELYAYIDNIIVEEREKQEEQRLREQEALLQSNLNTQQQFELQSNNRSNWYFDNPTSLNLGKQEFRKKWGPRKLEDNWRRKNKSTVTFDAGGDTGLGDEGDEQSGDAASGKKSKTNKFSRDYYLADIPFTDSAIDASHKKVQNALFEMGGIYSNELKDYEKAISAYKELLSRYPGYENKLQVYYRLYTIGKETNDKSLVSTYQQKIINEYPESNYAKVLTDPEYFKKIEEEEKKVHRQYAQTYQDFENRNFTQVASVSKRIIDENPEHELIPQFDYMLTIAEGQSKDTAVFIDDLKKLISRYPGSDIAENSNLLIAYLKDANPEAAEKQEIKQAVELYKLNLSEEHLVIVSVNHKAQSNQMMFNIINFNIDNFEEEDLKVQKYDLNGTYLLSVVKFKDSKPAMAYYSQLKEFPDLWRDVEQRASDIFVISKSNYELLKRENKLKQYLLFFKKQY